MTEHHLVVAHDFENYKRGDTIRDDAEIKRVLATDTAHHCHRIQKEIPVAPVKKSKSE